MHGKGEQVGKEKSQQRCQNRWCRQREGHFKNAHFWTLLSLALWYTFSLSTLFPSVANVIMMVWDKHMINLYYWGSHTLAIDWILLLQPKTCIRSSYKWNPLLTKASICHKLGFLHERLRKECISFLIPFLILFRLWAKAFIKLDYPTLYLFLK